MARKPSVKNTNPLKATNYAMRRSISPSRATFESFNTSDRAAGYSPVVIHDQTNRASFSNHDAVKDFKASKQNVVGGQHANLRQDHDGLAVTYTIHFDGSSKSPHACNKPELKKALDETTTQYAKSGGYEHLAERYVWKIAYGAALGRNHLNSYDKSVIITDIRKKKVYVFSENDGDFDEITRFPGVDALRQRCKDVDTLIARVADGLSGRENGVYFEVRIEGTLANGQEVFPSQVFPSKAEIEKDKEKTKCKRLVAINRNGVSQAALSMEKIGNATRHIDEWHNDPVFGGIAVEAYGYVQSAFTALRYDSKYDAPNFYDLLWEKVLDFPAQIAAAKDMNFLDGNIHFFMAMLIRGGVFCAPSEKGTDDEELSDGSDGDSDTSETE